jgi:hypothetical protein
VDWPEYLQYNAENVRKCSEKGEDKYVQSVSEECLVRLLPSSMQLYFIFLTTIKMSFQTDFGSQWAALLNRQ